jgi:hypothetical protein
MEMGLEGPLSFKKNLVDIKILGYSFYWLKMVSGHIEEK